MSATQKDIARVSGVNQSTVSRILRNDYRAGKVSEKIQKKVLAVAEELKYQTNISAATMRNKRNKSTVALICSPDIERFGHSYHSFLFKLIRHLNELSYGVRLYSSGNYEAIFREIKANQIYYVICSQHSDKDFLKLSKLCKQYKVKAIFNSGKEYIPEIPVFADDNEANIRLMVRYLYEKGHRRIGFVAGDPAWFAIQDRIRIFSEEMAELDLPCPPEFIYQKAFQQIPFLNFLKNWQGTALCCMDKGVASLVEHSLLYASFRIPEEISLISLEANNTGCDDEREWIRPVTTHIRVKLNDNFRVVTDYLFTEGSENHAEDYTRFLAGTLIEADTVSSPRKDDLKDKFALL